MASRSQRTISRCNTWVVVADGGAEERDAEAPGGLGVAPLRGTVRRRIPVSCHLYRLVGRKVGQSRVLLPGDLRANPCHARGTADQRIAVIAMALAITARERESATFVLLAHTCRLAHISVCDACGCVLSTR